MRSLLLLQNFGASHDYENQHVRRKNPPLFLLSSHLQFDPFFASHVIVKWPIGQIQTLETWQPPKQPFPCVLPTAFAVIHYRPPINHRTKAGQFGLLNRDPDPLRKTGYAQCWIGKNALQTDAWC